jgi:hypothetical protein
MRWIFFFRSKHFNQTFCVCADGCADLSKAFHYPIQSLTFLFAFLNLSTNFENAYIETLFCGWSMFSSAYLSLAAGKMCKNQLVSGMMLQNHMQLPECLLGVKIAALGSLKRVTGRIFRINK